jgi:hypothetical protein
VIWRENARRGRHAGLRVELLDPDAGDRARDDDCWMRSHEDVGDLRVAVPALDRKVARVAVTTQDLDRSLGDPDRLRFENAKGSMSKLKAGEVAVAHASARCAPTRRRPRRSAYAGDIRAGVGP